MNNRYSCIILFAKYPQQGKVKTRLAKKTGNNIAVSLYKNFILDILNQIKKIKTNIIIAVNDKKYINNFKEWLGNDFEYMVQRGDNLGERMKNTFTDIFKKGYNNAIIIGSDIPDISSKILKQAMISFKKYDAVIGPGLDGGYYLIGFNKDINYHSAFCNIIWSSYHVFNDTLERLEENNINYLIHKTLNDIDTYEDLIRYFERNKYKKGLKTIDFIRKNFDFN